MISQSIHGYTIKMLLGTGGMAEIYYAETSLGRPVAVKVLKREFSENSMVKDRFIVEAKTTVKLHHPNIREVYDLGKIESRPVIIMEYLEGQSLWDVFNDRGKVDKKRALDWFHQTVLGLQYAHKQGVIHRDIKPSNLFLTNEGTIKILDFGIAKVKENITLTQTGQTLGTMIYMSPEQVMDPKRVDERTDIYSLGVTFYHLLTGKLPYDITTDSGYVIQKKIVEEEMELEGLSEGWKVWLGVCLRKETEGRNWEAVIDEKDQSHTESILEGETGNGGDEETVVIEQNVSEKKVPKEKNQSSWWSYIRPKAFYLVLLFMIPLLVWGVWKYMPDLSIDGELKPYYDADSRLWGVKRGEDVVVKPEYHYIHPFSEGMARVEESGIFGVIDSTGQEIIPLKYDFIGFFSNGLVLVVLDGKMGLLDKIGRVVIPIKFDHIGFFYEGLASVKFGGEYSFIDRRGREVIALKDEYDGWDSFSEGLSIVVSDNKHGFIDKTGREVIPLKYDDADGFSEGLAKVELNGKEGFIDTTGQEAIPLKYDVAFSFSEGMARVKLNGMWGFINREGQVVIPFKYDFLSSFSGGMAKYRLDGMWGFIDYKGRKVIPSRYDEVNIFRDGLASVKLNGKWGFIDKRGEVVIPFKYEDSGIVFSEGLASAKWNGKWGVIDRTGQEVIPFKYDEEIWFIEGLALVKRNGKHGFIDRTGQVVIPLKYEDAGVFSDGLAKVGLNGKWGFIDRTGQEVIPLKYDEEIWLSEGLAKVGMNGKWGFIDRMGKEVIPLKYDWVESYNYGLAYVGVNSKSICINKRGRYIPDAFCAAGE